MDLRKIYPNILDTVSVEKIHLVPSKSQPGIQYRVRELREGKLICECVAYEMSTENPKNCKHCDIVKLSKKKNDD